MSNYKGIKGFQVQTRTEDPVPFAQAIQNNPYAGVWGSGGDLNTAGQGRSSAGTQTSNIVYGGAASPFTAVEEYDGTSWTETTEINTGKIYAFGFGANAESALMSGGYTNPSGPMFTNTETWNGSSWTEVNEMNAARGDGGSFGVVPGGIAAGGYSTPPTTTHDDVESWNGTSWSDSAAELNQARYYGSGVGYTSTAGLIIGGKEPSLSDKVESWNGSSWTEIAEINTARERVGGSGSSTAGLVYGGGPSASAATEDWNGTVWTEVNDMATARYGLASSPSGTSTVALASGGYTTTTTAATEEWSFSGLQPTDPAEGYANAITGDFYYNSTTGQFKTVNTGGAPIGTWASSTSLNTPRGSASSWGTATSSVAAGGNAAPQQRLKVETWNGSTWTETTNLSNSRVLNAGLGNSNSDGYVVGNESSPNLLVEQWNGSSWTEVNDINNPHNAAGVSGTSTSGIVFGGEPNSANAETWDGSSWTETSNLNTGRAKGIAFGGSSSDALLASGFNSPPTSFKKNTEIWDGTSWTEVNDMNDFHQSGTSGGTSSVNGIGAGGDAQQPPGASRTANTEFWNGTSWTEVNNMGTARMDFNYGFVGSSSSTLAIGGNISTGDVATVEEWTADLANKTITAS